MLELAENGELLTFIKQLGSFDETCSRYYGAQLLDTIDGIHKAGILHRDIKPENILLDSKMRIRVTDFGSAKIMSTGAEGSQETAERANSFVGTAEYVSPELLTDKEATRSSDWWAFGCVLYQMLAGRPPFKGPNEYQTFQKILKREFTFPEGFSASAQELIEKLLVLDPTRRMGANTPDVDEMRSSTFFKDEDFSSIWDRPAPELKVGIYQRPPAPAPQPSPFDETDDDGLVSDFQSASITSPVHSTAEDADASDVSADPASRPASPSRMPARPHLLHRESQQSIYSSSSSADGPNDSSADSPPSRLRRRLSQGVPSMPRQFSNWGALLLPTENLLLATPILQRKTVSSQMFNKRRQLVLTSFPRLLCVKESSTALKVKSEIILRPTSTPQQEGSPIEASQITATSIDAKGSKVFAVHTVSCDVK